MNDLSCIVKRESGLPAVLTGRQMSMVAFGTVISYGLVSGSAFPLFVAGPAAVPAYLAAASLAVLLIGSLARLAASHPTPGAFASHAEGHLGSAMGFLVRAAYAVSLILIIGTEVSLLVPVLNAWLPHVDAVAMLAAVLAGLALVNMRGAKAFAQCEVALSTIKLLFLVALIGLAGYYAAYGVSEPAQASGDLASIFRNVPLPNIWKAFMLAALGFVGIESLAIVAAETQASAGALRRRMHITALAVVALALVAAAAAAVLLQSGAVSLSQPPFGALLALAGLPWPNTLFRVLVLVTVLSVLNSQIYCASRMLFSMARAGQAPAALGRSSNRGPVRAVIVTGGLSITVLLLDAWLEGSTYVVGTAIATTGLLFVWGAIFLTHACHRSRPGAASPASRMRERMRAVAAGAGAMAVAAVAVSTLAFDEFAPTLPIGIPFMLLLWLGHALFGLIGRSRRAKAGAPASAGRLSAPLLVE